MEKRRHPVNISHMTQSYLKLISIFLLNLATISTWANDYGYLENSEVRLEIKDSIAYVWEDSVWVQLYPFELSDAEKIEAAKDPYVFSLKVNSSARFPQKWRSWTPTAYVVLSSIKNGVVRTLTVGENFLLGHGKNHSESNPKFAKELTLRTLSLKKLGKVSFSTKGQSGPLRWDLNIESQIDLIK